MKSNPAVKFLGYFLILALTVVIFFFSQSMPLLATLGFESGSLLAALFGPLYFMAAASQSRPTQAHFSSTLAKIGTFLVGHLLVLILLLGYNGFFLASCSPSAGLIPFLVALVPSLLLNASLGTLVASLVSRPLFGILITLAFYCGYYALIAASWWLEPTFRILTHFSLIIESDLLQGASLAPPIYAFRLATLLFAFSVVIFGRKFLGTTHKMFSVPLQKPQLSVFIVSLVFLAGLFLHVSSLKALGKNHRELTENYALSVQKNNIIVRADPTLTRTADAQKILNEALYFHHKIGQQLGSLSNAPVTIWLHQSHEQKFLYTGARNVHFALPKHREIHIVDGEVPHGVLGHELAHIFAGEFSKTLIGLPGQHFIVPNMALTEGVAMVLSSELNLDNDLTLLEQAQALHHAKINVNIPKLFSLNPKEFAISHPRSSYIYSGAFLEFVLKDLPKDQKQKRLIAAIAQGDIAGLFSEPKDHDQAIVRFAHFLDEDAAPYAVAWAQNTFLRHSILGKNCKETFASPKNRFAIALLNSDVNIMKITLDAIPENSLKTKLALAGIETLQAKNDYQGALALIEYLKTIQTNDINFALTQFNSLFHLGQRKAALQVLMNLDEKTLSPYEQRRTAILNAFLIADMQTVEPKNLYSAGIAVLFANGENRRIKLADFSYYLGGEKAAQNSSLDLANLLAHYIYGRIKMGHAQYDEALAEMMYLQKHLEKLPPSIQFESQKILAQAYMQLGQINFAQTAFSHVRNHSTSAADLLYATSMVDRMTFASTLKN